MLRFDDAEHTLDLGVHDLIEAGPPRGDLALQVAWSARARMRAGQVVHSRYQAARSADDEAFRAEVTVRHTVVVRGWTVTVSGRIDGLTREGDHVVVEEVKSTPLPESRLRAVAWSDFPAWARQVQLYLYLLAEPTRGEPLVGRLVIISLADGSQRVLQVPADPGLAGWVAEQLDWILFQRELRLAWMARRRGAAVPFAHDTWRPGQQALAHEAVERLAQGRHLLLNAPTGYGKTAAVLHAALRVAYDSDRRVFFATARTTQQRMAEDTLRAMAARGLPVRAVSIRAREKVCLNRAPGEPPNVVCRADACRYAEGYFDKVREGDLVQRLCAMGAPTPDEVVAVAEAAVACPFALSIDLAAQADVVVGDYNYLFDPAIRLAAVSDAPGEWIAVVDEAHNLPDRAMGYGSPELSLVQAEEAVDTLVEPRWRACRELASDVGAWLRAGIDLVPPGARDGEVAFRLEPEAGPEDAGAELRVDPSRVRALAERFDGLALEYAMLKAESSAVAAGAPDPWMDLARGVLRMRAALERAGPETVGLWRRGEGAGGQPRGRQLSFLARAADPRAGLKLLCRDPSVVLAPSFADLAASACMSATLDPPDFYRSMFGLPEDRLATIHHPSPFPPENRRVVLLPQVSTEYRHRDRDRAETAALIGEAVAAVPGNVAVYFPSFAFRDAMLPLLDLGGRPALIQNRVMSEAARTDLLDTLARGEGHVLLAVLGGIFSEGVDLPGEGLLAAVIVGPALPQANLERRLLQEWFQERYAEGFRYAWLVPGMSRVVQAAGRVIRSPEDRGAIVLICRRFLQRDYQAFFPVDWHPRRSRSVAADLEGLWDRPPREPGDAR